MAKCVRCGRGGMGILHPAVRIKNKEMICSKCFKALGFSPFKEATTAQFNYSWDEIKDGKDAYLAKKANKAAETEFFGFKVVGTSYENEDGMSIQRILGDYIEEQNYDEDQYGGMTKKTMMEDLMYGERVYQYDVTDADAELVPTEFEGKPAVKVMLIDGDPIHIGWIAASKAKEVIDLLDDRVIRVDLELTGGKYETLTDDDEIETDEIPYGGSVQIIKKK